ncbi:MAG: hypothetical protein AAGC44_08125 [Planctomycetota bacterium]
MNTEDLVHFLLVEDDPGHAELIKRNPEVERVRNTLDHVEDGVAALQHLRGEPPCTGAKSPPISFDPFRQIVKDLGLYWGGWNLRSP